MSPNADRFVSPLSLEVLSAQPIYGEEYLEPGTGGDEVHLSAARWADIVCIAPATCNTLARVALGLADDFLTTTLLAFEGPLVLVPAMSTEMWAKPITQTHLATLRERGATVVGPVRGRLADGQEGMGRMAEPEEVVAAVEGLFQTRDLESLKVVVTAGPTREAIDPVRFLSNRSSGRMGFSLAAEAAARGAETLLISGPVDLPTPFGVERIDVESAQQMQAQLQHYAADADIVIMAAAVSDFRPAESATQKLKKSDGIPRLELVTNPDLLANLARIAPNALRVGFAAETEKLEVEGARKLQSKSAHFIVANDVSGERTGFDVETNEVLVLSRDREPRLLGLKSKRRIAAELLDIFSQALEDRETRPVTRG